MHESPGPWQSPLIPPFYPRASPLEAFPAAPGCPQRLLRKHPPRSAGSGSSLVAHRTRGGLSARWLPALAAAGLAPGILQGDLQVAKPFPVSQVQGRSWGSEVTDLRPRGWAAQQAGAPTDGAEQKHAVPAVRPVLVSAEHPGPRCADASTNETGRVVTNSAPRSTIPRRKGIAAVSWFSTFSPGIRGEDYFIALHRRRICVCICLREIYCKDTGTRPAGSTFQARSLFEQSALEFLFAMLKTQPGKEYTSAKLHLPRSPSPSKGREGLALQGGMEW